MKEITVKGKIEFKEEKNKQYDREFTAILKGSNAFEYGNKTCVMVVWGEMANGKTSMSKFIDTRYDTSIKKNYDSFVVWVKKWFAENYQEHELTIYDREI